MSNIIYAPNSYENKQKLLFLAGSIDNGKATDWQSYVSERVKNCTVLNPRRKDWDPDWIQSTDNKPFVEQVKWELKAQEKSDLIAMYLEPNTLSQISLLELGLFHNQNIVVCCPEGYGKKGNVDIVCEVKKIPTVDSLDDLIEYINTYFSSN